MQNQIISQAKLRNTASISVLRVSSPAYKYFTPSVSVGNLRYYFKQDKEFHNHWNSKYRPGRIDSAGSAIVFTEALTHGALPWKEAGERRTIFYKYSLHFVSWAAGYFDAGNFDDLTERQQDVLEPPNARYGGGSVSISTGRRRQSTRWRPSFSRHGLAVAKDSNDLLWNPAGLPGSVRRQPEDISAELAFFPSKSHIIHVNS